MCLINLQVIVDIREFRSALPCLLYHQNFRVIPVTLEVKPTVLGG